MITSPTKILENNKTIELSGISKKYPLSGRLSNDKNNNFEDFWALKSISLEVYQGEILGIIGRNGAGKTTLLNIIAGVLSPTEGKFLVNRRVLGLFNLGVGFQDELTGRENIFLNGAILGATKKELEERLHPIIEFSELGEFINMPLGTYSQGMRLRLGFSIIANLDFDILVIDEILAVGDALFQSKCFQRLMDFKRLGKTLVLTSQSMDLIERLCDKAALLDHGRLLFYGDPVNAIDRYRALLNTEKFFVGPKQKEISLVENTKKWVEDISEWGGKLGTKEVIIESVEFINKFGKKCKSIRSRDHLTIKVNFDIRNIIKEPHFGVAIFRNDGVYCYGPNTAFDGYEIPELLTGKGFFILDYQKLLLAAGDYRVSVVVWDKNEVLPFDYHSGYYKLKIHGTDNKDEQLLNMPFKYKGGIHLDRFFNRHRSTIPGLNLSQRDGKENIQNEKIGFISVKLFDSYGKEKDIFMTNEYAEIRVDLKGIIPKDNKFYLWLGILREDGIYCQGITVPLRNEKKSIIVFPKFALLPGRYKISLGAWDNLTQKFLIYIRESRTFGMAFTRQDHGTVYLEHKWKWSFKAR